MKKILVFGAGRSAWYTIRYLLDKANTKNWEITIADSSEENLRLSTAGYTNAITKICDINNEQQRINLIHNQHIVISLLPAIFHHLVAQECLSQNAHLITPSYLTPEIQILNVDVQNKKLIFLNELGLDPGIDHMSAMEILERLKAEGAQITDFKSYTGGLISEKDNDNPFYYKLSWNPYNVIRAGNFGGLYYKGNQTRFVPYTRLFAETETIDIENSGKFTAYLNRSSLPYRKLYELEEAETFIRGTLRYPNFCESWHILVNLGITNDVVEIENLENYTWETFFNIFLPDKSNNWKSNLKMLFADFINDDILNALSWLGFGNEEKISLQFPEISKATPAQLLQRLLEKKWALRTTDCDRIVMIHEIIYRKKGKVFKLQSWFDLEGEDSHKTAMAKTVGLPLAIAAELIADQIITTPGVILPTSKEIYKPLLKALEPYGIIFKEKVITLSQ